MSLGSEIKCSYSEDDTPNRIHSTLLPNEEDVYCVSGGIQVPLYIVTALIIRNVL